MSKKGKNFLLMYIVGQFWSFCHLHAVQVDLDYLQMRSPLPTRSEVIKGLKKTHQPQNLDALAHFIANNIFDLSRIVTSRQVALPSEDSCNHEIRADRKRE